MGALVSISPHPTPSHQSWGKTRTPKHELLIDPQLPFEHRAARDLDLGSPFAQAGAAVLVALPENPGVQDSYVLLLVLLSVFLGGMLVLLFVLLIICHRCCDGNRRYSRASDDPEKTNTTYLEESQPVQEITIRVDESDCLSAASSHDVETETERFLSTGTTGRRVSFNEAALFDHGKKTQEKGRRYTLTEGDFHHLKNARLTHLHLPAPP
ncbi:hypothetical protein AAFF_G00150840 [Aldrovandia affinis]|uniref:Uncharacterized protein n=1 Tax=Aldrovandia affinis TaxID=143900 RepID=A0AAD7RPI0_9TELE|nr:hypothetical protein AAFF_G00150840 [Aldrovandia affinis]